MTRTITNAELVRNQIALMRDWAPADVVKQAVVDWAVNMLAMKRSLARVYVKGNWDRV